MNKIISPSPIIKSNNIDEALSGQKCPYCGTKCKISEHNCDILELCCQLEKTIQMTKWATHSLCGKVMVLEVRDGLALIENDIDRYVAPLTDIKFGDISKILDTIEESDLSSDEIQNLINALRLKHKEFNLKLPPYPELMPGHKVELKLGKCKNIATIRSKNGAGYKAVIDNSGQGIIIYPKHIIRIV